MHEGKILKEKRFILAHDFRGFIYSCLVLLFLDHDKTDHHGRKARQSKVST
jgi:hypothetical protein